VADVGLSLGMVWSWSSCDTVRRGFGVVFGVVAVGISENVFEYFSDVAGSASAGVYITVQLWIIFRPSQHPSLQDG